MITEGSAQHGDVAGNRRDLLPGVAIVRSARTAAAQTPESRDRVVDLLRAGSLVIVVLGHMLMAVVVWRGTSLRVDNLLQEIPELKLATWALQVMPVFFAAGAIANRMSITSATARGEPWRSWLWHRVRRFVRPVVFYVAIVIPLAYALAEIVPDAAGPLGKLSTQLLWFLGVYVLITAATPWEIRLARHGLPAIFALLIGVVVIDLARFHVWAGFGAVNFVLVWFMAATLGLIVRDRVDHDRRTLAFLALGALAVNIVLVVVTELPYPISMVGMPGERVSNMSPPTLVLALHSVVLVAVMGLAWPALRVLCATPRVWRWVVTVGAVAMTIYLWHLTALVLLTVAEHELGLDRGGVGGAHFWWATPLHLAIALLLTAILVAFAAPFEHLPVPWLERAGVPRRGGMPWSLLACLGAFLSACGFLVVAATGMNGFPFSHVSIYAGIPLTPGIGVGLAAVGILCVRAAARQRTDVARRDAVDRVGNRPN